ncbi:MAG: hypothetical protein J7M39_10405 [Anaerolineae bacterium]|nr:hypothetical protein [Anaerolineae bacterium]
MDLYLDSHATELHIVHDALRDAHASKETELLVKHWLALDMVQLERVSEAGYLDDVNVLLLTCGGQTPSSLKIHEALAAWAHGGHVLIFFGTGDAYDEVANGGVGMA